MIVLNKGTKRKNLIIVFFSIFVISLILITVNIKSTKATTFLEYSFVWLVSPFQSLLTSAISSVSETIDHYFFLAKTSKKNKMLQRKINILIQEKNQLYEQLLRQKRIYNLLQLQENREGTSEAASIIGRDATQWSKVVFIDKGTNQGINKNYPVVTHLGVIGQVVQPNRDSSKVLLITDGRSAIDVLFQDSRVSGVVVGTGGDLCDMRFVPIDAVVNVGDKIISSGMGGVFPKGLIVGTVANVTKKKQGLFQEISVSPNANLAQLEEVLVLMP